MGDRAKWQLAGSGGSQPTLRPSPEPCSAELNKLKVEGRENGRDIDLLLIVGLRRDP